MSNETISPLTSVITEKLVSKKRFRDRLRKHFWLYLLAAPGIIFFLLFSYLPMAGIIIAFQDFTTAKGVFDGHFIGLKNFNYFFGSVDFFRITGNTLYLNVLFIAFNTITQVGLAILLNEIRCKVFKRVSQSFAFLPYFVSWIVVSMMAQSLFSSSTGLIPAWQRSMNQQPINWYNRADLWPFILIFFNSWKCVGSGAVIYLASIASINMDLYEAARVDGANRWQQIRHITLPMLAPTISVLTLLAVGRIFVGDFGMIYGMVGDNGSLLPTTDVIDTFVFRSLRLLNDVGMASAVGLYQSVMGFVMVVIANHVIRKVHPEGALF